MISPKLVEVGRHENIELITCSDVKSVEGEPGDMTVTLSNRPRYIDPVKKTGRREQLSMAFSEDEGQTWTDNVPDSEIEENAQINFNGPVATNAWVNKYQMNQMWLESTSMRSETFLEESKELTKSSTEPTTEEKGQSSNRRSSVE